MIARAPRTADRYNGTWSGSFRKFRSDSPAGIRRLILHDIVTKGRTW